MNFCKDCAHMFRRVVYDNRAQCNHPRSFAPDPVDGKETGPQWCSTMREKNGRCGPDAQLFQAKPE